MTTQAHKYLKTSSKPRYSFGLEGPVFRGHLFADSSAYLLNIDTRETEFFTQMDSYKLWRTFKIKERSKL
jgi:hypothetical protein